MIIVVSAVSLVLPIDPAGADAGQGIERTGYLARPSQLTLAANGNLLIDARARRAYQAELTPTDMRLHIVNLDSLNRITTMMIPELQSALTVQGSTDWLWALDADRHRIFAIGRAVPDPSTNLQSNTLIEIDVRRQTASQPKWLWPLADRAPLAMSFHAPSQRLYILSKVSLSDPIGGRSLYYVEQRRLDGTLDWDLRLEGCWSALDYQYPPTIVRSVIRPSTLYVNCYNQGGIQAQVVRVNLGSPPTQEIFPAVPGALSTKFDPGSDRMFFMTTNSGAGRGAWVFDGLRSSFLGVIASGDPRAGATEYAMGLDYERGRLYMQTPVGLIVADARRTPLPAGLLFRQYAGTGIGTIQVDPVKHNVFVPDYKSLSSVAQARRYAVFRDAIPNSSDPAAGNPDAFTIDVPEKAGVTDANISGSSRAYGMRFLMTGGMQKGAWNVALGSFRPDAPSEEPLPAQIWSVVTAVPVGQGNRDLMVARTQSVALTNDSADAIVAPLEADPETMRDVENRDLEWPFPSTECHSQGKQPDTSTGPGGTAGATCDVSAASTTGSAGIAGIKTEGGEIRAESLFSWGSVTRDAVRGLVSRSVASASNVRILDRVWIGSIATEAESWAHGRPGTAKARFTRTFGDVRIDTDGDGSFDFSCGTQLDKNACGLTTVKDAANRALAGSGSLEFPEPDPEFFPSGSKGGFQALVQKYRFREFADRALNDDDSVEVPGLQLIVYGDARAGRTRSVVQLAGVQAESHYGVYLLPGSAPDQPAAPDKVVPIVRPAPSLQPVAPVTRVEARRITRTETLIEKVVRRVAAGLGVFASPPERMVLLAALWAFLLLPGYLIVRRRFIT